MTTAAIAAAQAQVIALNAQIGQITNASLPALAPAIMNASSALDAIDAAIVATDALIATDGVCGIVSGLMSPALAAALTAQLAICQNAANLQTLRAYIARVLFNLSNATG